MAERGETERRLDDLEQWQSGLEVWKNSVEPWKGKTDDRLTAIEHWKMWLAGAVAVLGALGIGGSAWVGTISATAKGASSKAQEAIQTIDQKATEAVRKALGREQILPGTIIAFGGEGELKGNWVLCDGSPIDIRKTEHKQFAALRDVIGKSWGDGGSPSPETFNLPDLRGVFLRGVDDPDGPPQPGSIAPNKPPAGKDLDDPTRKVGSPQGDALAEHGHFANVQWGSGRAASSHGHDTLLLGDKQKDPSQQNVYSDNNQVTKVSVPGGASWNVSATETRPKNRAVNFFIKY